MGNDGGSIPKRRELVKSAARAPTASELKATALESQTHAWTVCPLSSSPLDPRNTVSDCRGRLYNYESVLRCLMPSDSSSSSAAAAGSSSAEAPVPELQGAEFARSGIRSLRDVVKLKFTLLRSESDADTRMAGNGNGNVGSSVISTGTSGGEFRACPISMKELGATTRAVYIVPCGHVFAEAAMREVAETQCPECSTPFEARDVVPVLPTDAGDIDRCTRRVEELRALGLAHNLKKDGKDKGKKNKKRKAEEAGENGGGSGDGNGEKNKEKKREKDNKNDISSRINNSMTATLTAKVLAEQEELHKRRRMAEGYKRSETVR